MLGSCFVLMQVKTGTPPPVFATGVPALFEALLDVFAPLDVTLELDDEQHHIARLDPVRVFATEALWCDEELTRDALTRCRPTLGTDVVAELYDRCARIAPQQITVTARGAVHHRASNTAEPAWYGRWRGAGLQDLVKVAFRWNRQIWRGFELESLGGYPFAPIRPLVSRFGDGEDAIAAQNRALWFPALANVRAALGFDREEVDWSIQGEGSDEIRNDWLARLR